MNKKNTILKLLYILPVLIFMLCASCLKTTSEFPIELIVSQNTITFPSSGGEQSFSISSNTNNWTVSSDGSSWLSITPVSSSKNGEVKITVMENKNSCLRTAKITARGTGVTEQSINITQMADHTLFDNDIIAAINFGSGNGTEDSPYLIESAGQLKKVIDDVNNGNTYANIFVKLTTDIHVTADEWIPVGHSTNKYFRGFFDGNGHTISGALRSGEFNNFGVFGYIRLGAYIANLTINAIVINERDLTGEVNTGGIVGKSDGNTSITNCLFTGSVTGGTATSSIVVDNNTGGILGFNEGLIQNCEVSGQITGGDASFMSNTGGIAGKNGTGEIIDCTVLSSSKVTGGIGGIPVYYSITGGIAGYNNGLIKNCTNHSDVSSSGYCGGLVGWNMILSSSIHTGLNTGIISSDSNYAGGLVGNNYEGYVYSCCTNLGLVNGQMAIVNNQIGFGKTVESCPDGHSKR